MYFQNQKHIGALKASRKFARVPIVVTCFGVALLGSVAAGGLTVSIGIVLLIIISLVIHGNSINDLSDYEIDKVNLKKAHDRPLVSGDISLKQFWWVHAISGIVAVSLSLFFGVMPAIVTFAVVVYDYIYSLRPLRITDKTILSPLTLAAAYTYQPFTLGYYSANQSLDYPWLLATAIYFGFLARLLLKDFRDVKGDAKFGKKTFLLRYDNKVTCVASGVSAVASLVFVCFAVDFSPGVLAVLFIGNGVAVLLLARLAKTKGLAKQLRIIGLIAKIANSSILVLFVYHLCRIYIPDQSVLTMSLPSLIGILLLYAIARNSYRDV